MFVILIAQDDRDSPRVKQAQTEIKILSDS